MAVSFDTATSARRWARSGLLLLVIYASLRAAAMAIAKPFWYDELFTWAMTHQPDVATLWNALLNGGDSMTPVFELVERACVGLPLPELGMRLPSIAGIVCVLLCLFAFVGRRSGAFYGLIAASIALLTQLYDPFAVEARAYSLLAACVALALVAYQRAPAPAWVALMGFALALGQCLHYYAIFAFLPFIAAELYLTWQTRRARVGVWIALAVGAAPLGFFWPLLARFKVLYGDTFWARPMLGTLYDAYGYFLKVSPFWGLAIAVVCGLAIIGALTWVHADFPAHEDHVPPHERVLVFVLLAMPALVFAATLLVGGAFSSRYVLYAVLGVPLAVGLILPRIGRPASIVLCSLLVLALVLQESAFWLFHARAPGRMASPAAGAEALLLRANRPGLPVVVSDSHDYFVLTHYASPMVAERLYWIADAAASLEYAGSDTDDRTLPLLARYFPLKVDHLDHFVAQHPQYLLYSSQVDDDLASADWWPQRLLRDGFQVTAVAADNAALVFLVSAPAPR